VFTNKRPFRPSVNRDASPACWFSLRTGARDAYAEGHVLARLRRAGPDLPGLGDGNNIISKIVVAHWGVPPLAYASVRFALVARWSPCRG
jgi:hypothetical protein